MISIEINLWQVLSLLPVYILSILIIFRVNMEDNLNGKGTYNWDWQQRFFILMPLVNSVTAIVILISYLSDQHYYMRDIQYIRDDVKEEIDRETKLHYQRREEMKNGV